METAKSPRPDVISADVVVVGGGILGAVVTARAKQGLGAHVSVLCVRLQDQPHPRAESLRNQGLAQSGLRYLRDRTIANKMLASRKRLLDFSLMRESTMPGIMQMTSEQREEFLRQLVGSQYEQDVQELPDWKARGILGRLWDPKAHSFQVPEHQLDVAAVIEHCRRVALANGVTFKEVRSVRLKSEPKVGEPVQLDIDGVIVRARTVVFAAGCGNIQFLNALKDGHGYTLKQTPLLLVRGIPLITSPVLYDRVNRLSISAHRPTERIPLGCMVIGASDTERMVNSTSDAGGIRQVHGHEAEALFERIAALMPIRRDQCSITAGWEPTPKAGLDIIPQVFPLNQDDPDCQVLFAFSGRATIAMYGADQVIERLNWVLRKRSNSPTESRSPDFSTLGTDWVDEVHMHYEKKYQFRADYSFKRRDLSE